MIVGVAPRTLRSGSSKSRPSTPIATPPSTERRMPVPAMKPAASYSPAPRRREVWLAQPCPVIMPTAARIMWSEKTMPSAATAVVPRVETK